MIQKDSRLLRVGILGCGPISQIAHFDACRKARNAELYGICDAAPDLLKRAQEIHQPRKAFARFDEMLADAEIEAVIIGVADQFHVPLCLQALQAGKHVLVEKPLGITIEECESVRATLAKSELVFQIGHNRRFDPGIAFAKKFIAEEIGRLMVFKSWYCDSVHRYTMTDNLQPIPLQSAKAVRPQGNPKADKRRYFLLTHGSHLVDTARFLGGPLRRVRARLLERFGAYSWFVEADFESGALGHLDLTIPIRGDFEEGFQIYGEFGSAKATVYLPWHHKSSLVECFSVKDGLYRRPLGEDAYSYKLQIEGFARTILDQAPQHGANINDGVAGLRALVGIARSVESGEWVSLDDVTGGV